MHLPAHFWFYLGLAFILLHEMDAVRCHEWRIFPGLAQLPERWGFQLFMWAHVPLYYWLIRPLPDPELMRGLDLFFIVHLGLHLAFTRHPRNEFKDAVSWTIIGGAALGGLLDLLLI